MGIIWYIYNPFTTNKLYFNKRINESGILLNNVQRVLIIKLD